jgi:hypothetical protein
VLRRRFSVEIVAPQSDAKRDEAHTFINLEDQKSGVKFSVFLWPKVPEKPKEIAIIHFLSLIDGVSVSQQVLDGINSQLQISKLSVWEKDGVTIWLEILFSPKVAFSEGILNDIVDVWLADISTALSQLRRYSPNVRALREYASLHGARNNLDSVRLPIRGMRRATQFKNVVKLLKNWRIEN